MKAKRFLGNLIVLVIFSAAVFYIGWISFHVNSGCCAVMSSKTSGLYPETVQSGTFLWRWERLLPTNVTIEEFSLSPVNISFSLKGELPSSETFARSLDKNYDFSYSFNFTYDFLPSSQEIYSLYKEGKISSQADFNDYLEMCAKEMAGRVVSEIFSKHENMDQFFSSEKIMELSGSESRGFSMLDSARINNFKIPDYESYNMAKTLYTEYHQCLKEKMLSKAGEQAEKIAEENRTLEKVERLGQIMDNHPQLKDMFQNGDVTKILDSIRGL